MATFDVGIVFTAVNQAKGAFRSVRNDLKKTEMQANRTRKSLRAIQVVFAGIAIGAGVAFTKTIVKTVGEMELLIARLDQVQGGLGAARNTLARLTAQFAGTPFSVDAVANSFTRLRAAGLGTKDAFLTLQAGADAVAAFGGTTTELNRFIIGLQQSIGKGTLSMEELRQQIGEAVPSAMRVLAREMDISIGELFTQIEKGAVDSLDAVRLLTKGLNEDFGGFAQTLGTKIVGTLNAARGKVRLALLDLFTLDTTAAKQTVDFINRIGEATIRFIQNIDQGDVDSFFEGLNKAAGIVGVLVSALSTLGGAMLGIFNVVIGITGSQGAIVAASGLIGFLLWGGPVGAIIASIAAVGISISNLVGGSELDNFGVKIRGLLSGGGTEEEIRKKLKSSIAELQRQSEGFFTTIGNAFGKGAKIQAAVGELQKALKDLNDPMSEFFQTTVTGALEAEGAMEELTSLVDRVVAQTSVQIVRLLDQAETSTFKFGSQTAEKLRRRLAPSLEIVERFSKKIEEFQRRTAGTVLTEQQAAALAGANRELKSMNENIQKINNAIGTGEAKGLAVFADKVADKFTKAEIAVSKFGRALQGEDAKIQAVRDGFARLKLRIDEVIEAQVKLGQEGLAGIAKSNALLLKAEEIMNRRIVQIREELALKNQIFAFEQRSARLQIDSDLISLQREGRTGFQQSFASTFADQAQDKRLRLEQGILNAKQQILELDSQSIGQSRERQAQIQATQVKIGEFINAQQMALESTTAAGLLAANVWKDVGDTIQSSVKQALFDITKGTFDAERALLSFYDKITQSAIEYLVELVKIQFQQQLLGAAAGGGSTGGSGAGFFGFLNTFFARKGAVVPGGVQPFANGGIIRGPTMFGMAGEAGDEAILPLTRIGGQLGVRSEGGGGDTFHVTVNAIDAQSAASFFQRNAPMVVQAVRQETRLNNGIGAVR